MAGTNGVSTPTRLQNDYFQERQSLIERKVFLWHQNPKKEARLNHVLFGNQHVLIDRKKAVLLFFVLLMK
jgi:hypothetical protein